MSPDCHFTYCPPASADLRQGDVLTRSELLLAVLAEAHPHYVQEGYTHFIVVTQTCDLVRREGNFCKSPFITLAAVRPLEQALKREIAKYQDELTVAAGVCSLKHRERAEQFLSRLLNNNESEYFYLHDDAVLGIPEKCCAFLRLVMSLRSIDHYDKCLASRVACLTESFQAKLGWLMGNLYSRVGTEDWVPDHETRNDFRSRIQTILDSTCPWIDDDRLKAAKKGAPDGLYGQPRDTVRSHIESMQIVPKKARAINSVLRVLKEQNIVTDDAIEKKLKNLLMQDTEISSVLPNR